jgi:hypothetical protein
MYLRGKLDMKKYVLTLAALMVSAAPAYIAFQAQAEDAAPAAEAAATEVKELTLADGTKVHVKGEEVFVVAADGTETAAPDGEHALADGTTVKTMGGKLVTEEAAPAAGEAAPAEGAAQ